MRMKTARVCTALAMTAALGGAGAVAATSASAAPSCYITASAANVRASASTGAPIVGVAYKNYSCTELTGGKFTGSYWWYHLRITKTGVVGYVREDLVHGSGDVHTCIPEYC